MSRRYHSPDLPKPGERRRLSQATSHHLLRVRCLARGAELILFDGQGNELRCRLVAVEGSRALVEGLEAFTSPAAPETRLELLQALCKGPAFESALRMATELGVGRLRPVRCARSNLRTDRQERWQRVLVAAAEQCGRCRLPQLDALRPLEQVLADPELPSRRLVLVPGAGSPKVAGEDLALLVGPEGGLDEQELAAARAAGFEDAGLGPWTLRTDTAAAAALARYGLS